MVDLIEQVCAFLIDKMSVSDWISIVSVILSAIFAVATYRLRNSTLQQVRGTGNQVYNNCMITHERGEGIYPDHALAELSSRKLADRTRNYLKLMEKTILVLPELDNDAGVDTILRIDFGDDIFPIGLNTKMHHFDMLCDKESMLTGVPNGRLYICFTSFGHVDESGAIKRNWIVNVLSPNKSIVPNDRFGRIDESGKLQYAKRYLELGDICWWNPTPEMYASQGFKRVAHLGPPTSKPGFHYENRGWIENGDSITSNWVLVEDQVIPPPTCEELNTRLLEFQDQLSMLSTYEHSKKQV